MGVRKIKEEVLVQTWDEDGLVERLSMNISKVLNI